MIIVLSSDYRFVQVLNLSLWTQASCAAAWRRRSRGPPHGWRGVFPVLLVGGGLHRVPSGTLSDMTLSAGNRAFFSDQGNEVESQ